MLVPGIALILASCGSFGAGIPTLPEAAGWERLPVGRWLIEGIAPETVVVCRRPACTNDAMVARFILPDPLDGGAEALRKAVFPAPPASTKSAKSRMTVTPLAGEGATGLIVTMRAIADPNRTVVAVLAERPRATSTEVVLSIAAAEPVARDNALKAFGLPH